MAVVKADAYGHGLARMAAACAGRVDSFGVACVSEAEALRSHGAQEPIYLLGPALPQERERIVAGGFRPVISTVEEGTALAAVARAAGLRLVVQWALDTGMGRIGTLPEEILTLAASWKYWPFLELATIGSHFPSADEDPEFTLAQTQRFHATVAQIATLGVRAPRLQLCNSAGLMGYPAPAGHLSRAGLMLYGVAPFPEMQSRLHAVLTWKTCVSLVRELPAGWGINYGRSFITPRPMTVATLAVGYADGYPRALAGRGAEVIICGEPCPVLGRITMDQIVADVSHLPVRPTAGTEAVLLGRQGDEEISATTLAACAQTIPWEIFTNLRC